MLDWLILAGASAAGQAGVSSAAHASVLTATPLSGLPCLRPAAHCGLEHALHTYDLRNHTLVPQGLPPRACSGMSGSGMSGSGMSGSGRAVPHAHCMVMSQSNMLPRQASDKSAH